MEVDMSNMILNRVLICSALMTLGLVSLTGITRAQTTLSTDPGALVSMTMNGTVGVLLDEIPPGAWRENAAQDALQTQGNDAFWVNLNGWQRDLV
jgi:hypothetical protein